MITKRLVAPLVLAMVGCSVSKTGTVSTVPDKPAARTEPGTVVLTPRPARPPVARPRLRADMPEREGLERGGIEAGTIALDTTPMRYREYFDLLRQHILPHWTYPFEAGRKGRVGSLLVEIGIRRDGHLQFVKVQESSGVAELDEFALNAIRRAAPFAPIPEALLQGARLPILIRFRYIIEHRVRPPG